MNNTRQKLGVYPKKVDPGEGDKKTYLILSPK